MINKDFDKIHKEYREILDTISQVASNQREKMMHEYLEGRALLLPGQNGLNSDSHHGPFASIFFSKLRLQGTFRRFPDFVFVTKTSVQLTVVFIEIEDPTKKFFNVNDDFTSDFNQALQQLEDWKIWLEDDANKTLLRKSLNQAIDHHMVGQLPIKAEFVLVYGRNSEYEGQANKIRRLTEKSKYPYAVMSYDRLHCSHYHSANITVRQDDNGFYAIEIDEDYNYNQINSSFHTHLRQKTDAVRKNKYKSDLQKENLIKEIELIDGMTSQERMNYYLRLNFPNAKMKL